MIGISVSIKRDFTPSSFFYFSSHKRNLETTSILFIDIKPPVELVVHELVASVNNHRSLENQEKVGFI